MGSLGSEHRGGAAQIKRRGGSGRCYLAQMPTSAVIFVSISGKAPRALYFIKLLAVSDVRGAETQSFC